MSNPYHLDPEVLMALYLGAKRDVPRTPASVPFLKVWCPLQANRLVLARIVGRIAGALCLALGVSQSMLLRRTS